MIGSSLHEHLGALPGVRAFAHCGSHGEVLFSSGEVSPSLDRAVPKILHLAAELGQDLGLGALREAELHGQLHALCMPCEGGSVMVEAGSRAALSDASLRLHALLT